jgi:predicted nucleotidyltransferase
MIPLITDNLEAIRALCRRYGIRRLDLFGSAATGAFNPESSDIDFIVDMGETNSSYADRFFDLIADLESLLGYPVQMITERSVTNFYLRRAINEQRATLHATEDSHAAA